MHKYLQKFFFCRQGSTGAFCLGSQYTPILTRSELRQLIEAVIEKGWLEIVDEP